MVTGSDTLTSIHKFYNSFPWIIWRLPFDIKNPMGFSVAVFIQFTFVFTIMVTVKCVAIFGFGICSMLFPLIDDMKNNLRSINGNTAFKTSRSRIRNKFSHLVQFHSKLIQLSQTTQMALLCLPSSAQLMTQWDIKSSRSGYNHCSLLFFLFSD